MRRRIASSTVSRSFGLLIDDFVDVPERYERWSDTLLDVSKLESPPERSESS
jgi:hypothetical protein